MRCSACNKSLTDFEATRKTEDGNFLDLCNSCATLAGVSKTEDRFDLVSFSDYVDLEEYYEQDGTTLVNTGTGEGVSGLSDDY